VDDLSVQKKFTPLLWVSYIEDRQPSFGFANVLYFGELIGELWIHLYCWGGHLPMLCKVLYQWPIWKKGLGGRLCQFLIQLFLWGKCVAVWGHFERSNLVSRVGFILEVMISWGGEQS